MALALLRRFDRKNFENLIFIPVYELKKEFGRFLPQKKTPYKTLIDRDEEERPLVTYNFFRGKKTFHFYKKNEKNMLRVQKHDAMDAFIFKSFGEEQKRFIGYLNDTVVIQKESNEPVTQLAVDFFKTKVENGEGELQEDMLCNIIKSLIHFDDPLKTSMTKIVIGDTVYEDGKPIKHYTDPKVDENLQEEIRQSAKLLEAHHQKILKK